MSERTPPSSRINIKSLSLSQTKQQWKENIRKGCLERAKIARRERLRKSRSNETSDTNGELDLQNVSRPTSSKRCRDVEYNDTDVDINDLMVDHIPHHEVLPHMESCDSSETVVNTARVLVEEELRNAINGIHHCHAVCPLDGSTPVKRLYGSSEKREPLDSMDSEELNELQDGEYKISKEEFEELLNDVQEELQREDELLEEEIWELERAEAMERERLIHQIDNFESWEEQRLQQNPNPSTYISPLLSNSNNLTSPLVTCPICNSSSLMETPHDGIKCTNAPNGCTFQLDIAHEGLTLNHLQDQLRTVYEEHSAVCTSGVLSFRIEEKFGMKMLMAKCDVCSADVVVL